MLIRGLVCILGVLRLVLLPVDLVGQIPDHAVERSLACFARAFRVDTQSSCDPGVITVETFVINRTEFSDHLIDRVLDGLGDMALNSDHQNVRMAAAGYMMSPGSESGENPMTGIVRRAAATYRRSNDLYVRAAIIRRMSLQAEEAEAVEFLKEVAQENLPEEQGSEEPLAHRAISELQIMGPLGRAALWQLHKKDSVRNPAARAYLGSLARYSFQPPVPE